MGNAYLLNALRKLKFGGGSKMVWGMISLVGIGPLVLFPSNINASVYKELLCQNALPHLRKEIAETQIFMQDNMPCHKAKTMLSFLEEKGIAVMKWPPQSSDMNLVENSIWAFSPKLKTEILKILMIYGIFWKKNGEVLPPPFVKVNWFMWLKMEWGNTMQKKIH